jgi:TatD DNase family protein
MLDAHCHLDRYPDPLLTATEAERGAVVTIGVTNLPSHFQLGLPHLRAFRRVRLALGFHPLCAAAHAGELALFRKLLAETSYVGEVGLDFSKEGRPTRTAQERCFREVLVAVSAQPKFVSLHSRGAESLVLEMLSEFAVERAVFHWYTGTTCVLDRIAAAGHYFSVNPAMVGTPKGRAIADRIPPDRILTETDGPHVRIRDRPAKPADVRLVLEYLATSWGEPLPEVELIVRKNLARLLDPLRLPV